MTSQPRTVAEIQTELEAIERQLAGLRRLKRDAWGMVTKNELTAAIQAAESARSRLEAELREVMAQ